MVSFVLRKQSVSVGPQIDSKKGALIRPSPCSPESVPPRPATRSTVSFKSHGHDSAKRVAVRPGMG